ncbi:MAG: hypothetical protein FJ246_04690, partial [Nitrospira sp.]|nr:hypothetical protein [Nitrospira sp.]
SLLLWALPATENASAQVIRSGPSSCHAIALTFDLCPVREGSGYDAALIQTLIDRHIPATFFLSGRWMSKHDAEVRALLAVPFFELGTHGQAHAHLPLLEEDRQRAEIQDAVALFEARHGQHLSLFRPPYGEYDDRTVEIVRALGLRFILWSVVSGDPDPLLSRTKMVERLKAGTRNGSVIVFHANGKGKHTKEAVEDLYQELIIPKGLQPVTVSTLLGRCATEQDRHVSPLH